MADLPASPPAFAPRTPHEAASARVKVFWDMENCALRQGADFPELFGRLRSIAQQFGSVVAVRAYAKPKLLCGLTAGLLGAGVEPCPVPAGKEQADKFIVMDALTFALSECTGPSSCVVVIISGDAGFAPLLARLSARKIRTVIVTPSSQRSPVLAASANVALSWDDVSLRGVRRGGSCGGEKLAVRGQSSQKPPLPRTPFLFPKRYGFQPPVAASGAGAGARAGHKPKKNSSPGGRGTKRGHSQ